MEPAAETSEAFSLHVHMNRDSANKLICAVRWGHGMLQLLDEFKHSPETTLGELQKLFLARFQVDPGEDWFYFNNQDQFMTQLWAYLVGPAKHRKSLF
jgi:hypothetical protein